MPRSKAAFDFLMQFWHYQKVERWAARQPILKHIVRPNVSPERNQHIIIPINHVIHGTESVVLPPAVLEELISRASTVVAMNECLCRRAEHCHHYPESIWAAYSSGMPPGRSTPASAARWKQHRQRNMPGLLLGAGLRP